MNVTVKFFPRRIHTLGRLNNTMYIGAKKNVSIFEGIMYADGYVIILFFLRDVYHNRHRFVQDNDPKHTSKHTLVPLHFSARTG